MIEGAKQDCTGCNGTGLQPLDKGDVGVCVCVMKELCPSVFEDAETPDINYELGLPPEVLLFLDQLAKKLDKNLDFD